MKRRTHIKIKYKGEEYSHILRDAIRENITSLPSRKLIIRKFKMDRSKKLISIESSNQNHDNPFSPIDRETSKFPNFRPKILRPRDNISTVTRRRVPLSSYPSFLKGGQRITPAKNTTRHKKRKKGVFERVKQNGSLITNKRVHREREREGEKEGEGEIAFHSILFNPATAT